ncbi:Ig-like domain-containing protein [Gracilimonas sp.]|uniref:Ig-like domain-containing protein n=1 Tax=Gracilimonas sp. TaxID=1974203 RepID=UPI0032EB1338
MKTMVLKSTKRTILASLLLMFIALGCERSVDGLEEPNFPENPDVFIDGFSSGLEYYPFAGSRPDAFSVEEEDTYDNSSTAMRFDVPNEGDPRGAYAGAIFRDENGGRDLTSYNALTFYAKGTTAGTINEIGFGQDFLGNEYSVALNGLRLTTNWEKYVIPIPDASNLTSERGLFWYSEGPEEGDGYSFWVDELKYENLNGLAQPRPAIVNGNDETQTSFIGSTIQVSGLTFTINQANGVDVTVGAAPAYFTFSSSDTDVATVNENGLIEVVGSGTAEITASLGDDQANGSLTVESIGDFTAAPTPTEAPEDVISIFSDAYDNVPVDFYNGFYAPFQTTTSNDFSVNGNNVLNYENFNFVGIEFNQNVPTIDGSDMTNLSVDIYLPNDVPNGSAFAVNLRDFGADDAFGGGDDTIASTVVSTGNNPVLVSGQWININLDISGMANKSNLGQIVFDSDQGAALQGATIYVDNIYLYR